MKYFLERILLFSAKIAVDGHHDMFQTHSFSVRQLRRARSTELPPRDNND